MVMPEAAFFALTLPITLYVAFGDMREMKILNIVNGTLFAVFVLSGLVLLPLSDYGIRLAIGVAALVVGFGLNAAGQMGGGDGKFLAAALPFVRPDDIGQFFFVLAGCLLAALLVHRGARRVPAIRGLAPGWKSWTERKFPMGLGLAAALSFYLAIRGFSLSLPGVAG